MIHKQAPIGPAIAALLIFGMPPGMANAENILRHSAPIIKAASNAPVPAPDQGTPPSRSELLMLYRYESSLGKEGSSGLTLGFSGGSATFALDSPVNDQETSLQLLSKQGMAARSGPLSGTGDYSLGSWIKTKQASTAYIISQRDADNDGQFNLFTSSTGNLCFYDFPRGTGTNSVCSSTIINDDQWHHIGMSRAGGVISLFVDGNLEYSGKFSPNNNQADNGLAIGYDQRDNRSHLAANMKDLFIFNRALSVDEWLWLGKNGKSFPAE